MPAADDHIYTNWKEAANYISGLDNRLSIVFTNGCYDILHPGHHSTLEKSKDLGDILIVGLNSDDSVQRLKGTDRPIHNWYRRAQSLATLSPVDIVIGFDEDTPLDLITNLQPNIITKGGDYLPDQMIGADVVMSYGGEVIILPFLAGHSTTAIINKKK